jgi:hypothetical protein
MGWSAQRCDNGRFRVAQRFTAAIADSFQPRLYSLRKNSISRAILGGAALQRCGNGIVLNAALAAEATGLDRKRLSPQPLQPHPEVLKGCGFSRTVRAKITRGFSR